MSWHEEAIWNDNGAGSKDVLWNDLSTVWPFELGLSGVELGALETGNIAVLNSFFDAGDD